MSLPPVEIINENSVSNNKPVAYVLDDDKQIGVLVSRMLSALGYIALPFTEAAACLQECRNAKGYAKPSLILLDLSLGKSDALEVADQLKTIGYKGRVMLISGSDDSTLSEIRKMTLARGMAMLPSLKKPFRIDGLKECLAGEPEVEQGASPVESTKASIEWAVSNGKLELRYQLKYDLKTSATCGADALYFARHPTEGIVPLSKALPAPGSPLFAPLARFSIRQMMSDWTYHFSASKSPFKTSIKLPLAFVSTAAFISLVRENIPSGAEFPGFLIEAIDSKQFTNDKALHDVSTQLRLYRLGLSVDDVGSIYGSISQMAKFPFNELRLPPSAVAGIARDEAKKRLCVDIIARAHSIGVSVCAIGRHARRAPCAHRDRVRYRSRKCLRSAAIGGCDIVDIARTIGRAGACGSCRERPLCVAGRSGQGVVCAHYSPGADLRPARYRRLTGAYSWSTACERSHQYINCREGRT